MEYPEHLKLGEFVQSDQQQVDADYTLFSVVVHDGVATFGHYWIFMQEKGTWLKYNDSTVTSVQKEDVFKNLGSHTNACTLVYVKSSRYQDLVEPFARTSEKRSLISQLN